MYWILPLEYEKSGVLFPSLGFFKNFFKNKFSSSILFTYLFIYLAVLGLRFCARAFSSCGKRGPPFIVVRGPLTAAAPPVAEHKLQTHRLSSCGSWAQSLRGMWDPPRPGLEPVSPALPGRLSTTAPPGKPPKPRFLRSRCHSFSHSFPFYRLNTDNNTALEDNIHSRQKNLLPLHYHIEENQLLTKMICLGLSYE